MKRKEAKFSLLTVMTFLRTLGILDCLQRWLEYGSLLRKLSNVIITSFVSFKLGINVHRVPTIVGSIKFSALQIHL